MADLQEEDEGGGVDESWMATFADLATLLMTFFVLLYSMSSVDAKKFYATFSSVRDSFGGDQMENVKSVETQEADSQSISAAVESYEAMLEAQRQNFNQIRSFLAQQNLDKTINAVLDEGKIILRIPNEVLFRKGSELLSVEAEKALYALLQIFHNKRDQNINIKGYSDNSPVPADARFHDNWELSALRAVNILRFYLNSGVETHRITATGLGELEPLFPNDTEEHKAKNRRVEFVLEKESTKQ